MHVLWLEFCKDYQYQTWRLDNVTWKDAAESGKVTIDFVGDINFDPRWHTMKYAKKQGGITSCISEDILKELKSADITMVNNEFCYTKEKKSQEGKAYSFKANPKNVKLLEEFGTDIVSLANNHTCDYGEQGLLDTMDALTKEGIVYSGAGRNLAEASAVQYFVAGGRKIAFVSATEIERFYHYTKKAGEKTPGVLKTQQKKAVLSAVQSKKAKTVSVKWKRDNMVTGYVIQYSTDKNFKKNVKKVTIGKNKTVSTTIKKLKSKKTYYVRVASYKKVSGKTYTGTYSNVKKIKVK